MTEFVINSEQLERLIEAVEHDTGREINRVVIDGVRAAEIVRCEDCRFFDTRQCKSQWPFRLDGYCAWGEKREEKREGGRE